MFPEIDADGFLKAEVVSLQSRNVDDRWTEITTVQRVRRDLTAEEARADRDFHRAERRLKAANEGVERAGWALHQAQAEHAAATTDFNKSKVAAGKAGAAVKRKPRVASP